MSTLNGKLQNILLKIRNENLLNQRRKFNVTQRFVPEHNQPLPHEIEKFQQFIYSCTKLCVLTGAGVSTESGIPDYRSKDVGLYDRSACRYKHKLNTSVA